MTATEASRLGASHIQEMFSKISKRYDFLNHLLSLNRDKAWRRRAVQASQVKQSQKVLDVCSGTGDLAFEFKKACDNVVGLDFCFPMLKIAHQKNKKVPFLSGDCLKLPLPSDHFDVVSVAFGIRNVTDLDQGLKELLRVLKPQGKLIILEFTAPPGRVFSSIYNFYLHQILPKVASLFSEKSAYRYLPKSMMSFLDAPDLSLNLKEIGFTRASFAYLSMGIVGLHMATK